MRRRSERPTAQPKPAVSSEPSGPAAAPPTTANAGRAGAKRRSAADSTRKSAAHGPAGHDVEPRLAAVLRDRVGHAVAQQQQLAPVRSLGPHRRQDLELDPPGARDPGAVAQRAPRAS